MTEFEVRYRAVRSRDARFDGRFFTGVTSTRIYCRPICPAPLPKPQHVRFFTHAAAAESAGFRPCKRCRPEHSPDSPEWDVRADLIGRGLRLIADGVIDRDGVTGLASRLAVSERHLHRLFVDEVGASPVQLARSRRARLARQLLDGTTLPMTHIAYASGFSSLRAFNETIRAIYGRTPTTLRTDGRGARADGVTLALRYREPFDGEQLLAYLAARAIPGVEDVRDGRYRRTIRADAVPAVLELSLEPSAVVLQVHAAEITELASIIQRARRLLDLDADPDEIARVLGADQTLRPLVHARPGLRLPGAFDGFELAVRAIVGQQVTVAGAATIAGRVAARAGTALDEPDGTLTHLFPTPEQLARADLRDLGLPRARARTIRALAEAAMSGEVVLDGSADPGDVRTALLALPGIGPWTAAYIAMRALRDPDAFPATDLGVRQALDRFGGDADPDAWRPWRAYATMHLWTASAEEDR